MQYCDFTVGKLLYLLEKRRGKNIYLFIFVLLVSLDKDYPTAAKSYFHNFFMCRVSVQYSAGIGRWPVICCDIINC